MDAQRCAKTSKPLKQVFAFGEESKTTMLIKSKPCCLVLSCLAMFNDLLYDKVLEEEGESSCEKGSRSLS